MNNIGYLASAVACLVKTPSTELNSQQVLIYEKNHIRVHLFFCY